MLVRLPECLFIWRKWSCSGTKSQCDVKYVILRHKWQKMMMSTEVIDDGSQRSQLLQFGDWSAPNGSRSIKNEFLLVLYSRLRWQGRLLPTFWNSYHHSCFHSGYLALYWSAICWQNAIRIAILSNTLHAWKVHSCSNILRTPIWAHARLNLSM